MTVHYLSCFSPSDSAEQPLISALGAWRDASGALPTSDAAATPQELQAKLLALPFDNLDVLIIGGHGHPSLQGFWVTETPLRWHDLAFLLRGKLKASCSFVFYSCNGGYPGVMHLFGRQSGPDFVFGPRIKVFAGAMTHATISILDWKKNGGGNHHAAKALVDKINNWAKSQSANYPDHHEFLRVMWCEGSNCRHPDVPGGEKPSGSGIDLLEWGL